MELAKEMVVAERQAGSSSTLLTEGESPSYKRYLEKKGRPDLKEVLTPQTPYTSYTLEVGAGKMPFTGGLGILEGDKLLQAELSGIPYCAVTLAYSERWRQRLDNYYQVEEFETITPEDLGLERIGQTSVHIIGQNGEKLVKDIEICKQDFGSAQILALYHPDLKEVYYGSNNDEHRLFQQVVLGFGGQKALDYIGVSPSMMQLNESAKVFSGVAYLDDLIGKGMTFKDALSETRRKTLLTNHTLVPGAVQSFSRELFERLVMPNIESEEVKGWIRGMLEHEGGSLNLSLLAFELAGKQNGVSKLHAQIASERFRRIDGTNVHFDVNTNGIFMGRWTHPRFLEQYLEAGIIDSDHNTGRYALEAIDNLNYTLRIHIKRQAKAELVDYLGDRVDQDGQPLDIPGEAKIAVWSRRLDGYKQPFMFLGDPETLAKVLEEENMHIVMAGKAHPTSIAMKEQLRDELLMIHNHPVLRERVHFVQDYDADLTKKLVAGADIWLNTPKQGEEACGTSPWKAIVNDTIVVSTEDGGLADEKPAPYIVIEGDNIYEKLRQAAQEAGDLFQRVRRVRKQLKAYIYTVPSGQMQEKNINLGYTREKSPIAA